MYVESCVRYSASKKIGHTGTLDPFATGLLVIAVGKATRLIPYLEKAHKTYQATFCLDQTSPTLDPESECSPIDWGASIPTREDIDAALQSFLGDIEQVPPAFSAIKIKGERSYALARKGEKVEHKPRPTHVYDLHVLEYKFPYLKMEMRVAAGFYVRSLARDLTAALREQCNLTTRAEVGLCTELRRTAVGELSLRDAEDLERVVGTIDPKYILTDMQQVEIPAGRVQDFIAGRAFPFGGLEGDRVLVLCGGKTFGVGEITCGNLQPRVVM